MGTWRYAKLHILSGASTTAEWCEAGGRQDWSGGYSDVVPLLDRAGSEGWELVARDSFTGDYLFKRPVG